MPATKKKVVSVDGRAAKEAVVEVGRKAKKVASRKASAGSRAAKKKVQSTSRGAAKTIAGHAAGAKQFVGSKIEKRKNSAIRSALKTCVELSAKQLAVLQKLERSIAGT